MKNRVTVLLVGVGIAIAAWAFLTFDSVTDAASLTVSAGFLLVTVVYVVETRRMAGVAERTYEFERGREDRLRLETVFQHLQSAERGVVREFTYWRYDGAIGSVAEVDQDPPDPFTDKAFYWALEGSSMVTIMSSDLRANRALFSRCGLESEASSLSDAYDMYRRTVAMLMALAMRAERPEDSKARQEWERKCWQEEERVKNLPSWEALHASQPSVEISSALRAMMEAIERYWAQH